MTDCNITERKVVVVKCRVCDWEGTAEKVTAREMMYGTGEAFTYFICSKCHCLQIETIPDDLGKYYGNDYYSYRVPDITNNNGERKETRILDVGCGAGTWLCALAKEGYANLVGCDPFIETDLQYDNGVKIYKRTIHEMEGEFDWIRLNDSFEHMTDPHEVMDSIYKLLCIDGMAQISIPVFPNIAYDTFGVNWYQLDAPRHIVLYSREGFENMVRQNNLEILRINYNSVNSAFIRSFLYEKGIPYREQTEECISQYFSPEDINKCSEYAMEANEKEYGDYAIFSLKKVVTAK